MTRRVVPAALAMTLCLAVSLAHGEPRGRGGGESRKPEGRQGQGERGASRGGKQSPGGQWSERSHGGKQSLGNSGEHSAAAGHAAAKNKTSKASGAQGAAAGKAVENRNAPKASGAQGAAAGKAVENRNSPKATGAQGAAAGAAASNRNSPQYTGAQGAAAGAAAANRNAPQFSGAQGAAAGAAVANRNAPALSGAGGAAAYAGVRNSFHDSSIYGHQWYGAHPAVWTSSAWAAGAAWVPATWAGVAGYCGYGNATPTSYDYGVNVVAQDGNVMVDGQNVGTTEEFSQQAADLAQTGADAETPDTDQWLPVGVFAMVRNEKQHPQLILQLAINKQGVLRGNYTDELTDNTSPIHGAVDKQTQRAAWTVGGNKQTVMEAGLNDLTEGEAPALIHKNGKTDHWLLVRLDQPKPAEDDAK